MVLNQLILAIYYLRFGVFLNFRLWFHLFIIFQWSFFGVIFSCVGVQMYVCVVEALFYRDVVVRTIISIFTRAFFSRNSWYLCLAK